MSRVRVPSPALEFKSQRTPVLGVPIPHGRSGKLLPRSSTWFYFSEDQQSRDPKTAAVSGIPPLQAQGSRCSVGPSKHARLRAGMALGDRAAFSADLALESPCFVVAL